MVTHQLKNGKRIYVLDGLTTYNFRVHAHTFATQSLFKLGWEDVPDKPRYLHSVFDASDIERLGILNEPYFSAASPLLENKVLSKCVLNLTVPTDAHFVHAHEPSLVVLYYVNLEWEDGWHGETLFFEEDGKTIEKAFSYTPGRVLIFDGDTPHAIRPQSSRGPAHRFTLAMVYT